MKVSGVVSVLVVLSMLMMAARQSHAVNCGQIVGTLSPCLSYLKSGGSPSADCCAGVRKLRDMTVGSTQSDRRAACECIKDAASKASVNPDNASSLPGICKAPINIPISSSTNCQTIP